MIQPTTPISITLTAERWNQVLTLLDEVPVARRVTNPLINEIQQQCMRHDSEAQQQNIPVSRFPPPRPVPDEEPNELGAAE